ncbi:hypothetical protein SRABI118_01414 [Massilia sp. Bi118]|nr:hypothetical protein SRABI118_01414 [Massilia sp. Bi118]
MALDPLIVASASTGIMIIVLVTWGNKVHLNSSEWAGWVQAVGSISAILITLGLTNYQIKQQQKGESERAQEETRRICLAVRDELRILQKIIATSSNVAALLRLQPGEIFNIAVPTVVPNERFSIYRAVLGRLTMIEDDQLRQDIIWTYETAIGQIHAGLQNNRLLFELRELDPGRQADLYEFQLDQLRASATNMQQLCKQTIQRVSALLPDLDRATGRSQGLDSGNRGE